MEKTHTRRKPSQNTGMEKPDTEKTMIVRSTQEPWRQAASTPSGTASSTEVATEHIAEPDARLGEERLVEPQSRADLGDVLRGGVVAGDDLGGIAGREV